MSRSPYAAEQFLTEMQEINSRATMQPVDEPDGFRVHRSFAFDKTSSKTLDKILPLIVKAEDRIVAFTMEDGVITITFSHRTIADSRSRFALTDAKVVADSKPGDVTG